MYNHVSLFKETPMPNEVQNLYRLRISKDYLDTFTNKYWYYVEHMKDFV